MTKNRHKRLRTEKIGDNSKIWKEMVENPTRQQLRNQKTKMKIKKQIDRKNRKNG